MGVRPWQSQKAHSQRGSMLALMLCPQHLVILFLIKQGYILVSHWAPQIMSVVLNKRDSSGENSVSGGRRL